MCRSFGPHDLRKYCQLHEEVEEEDRNDYGRLKDVQGFFFPTSKRNPKVVPTNSFTLVLTRVVIKVFFEARIAKGGICYLEFQTVTTLKERFVGKA